MTKHVHIVPPPKVGRPVKLSNRCCRCGSSTRGQNDYICCSMSEAPGGTLCSNCIDELNIDRDLSDFDCADWAENQICCHTCGKVIIEIFACNICANYFCENCCCSWSIELFFDKGIPAVVCKKDFPDVLLSDANNAPLQHFQTNVMSAADQACHNVIIAL